MKGASSPRRRFVKKLIAGALVAGLLIGSAPGWAESESTAGKPTAEGRAQHQAFRDSIDRAIDRAVESTPRPDAPGVVPREPEASGPQQLTARERRDLDARRAALETDPVARGTGGIILMVVGVAASIAVTAWAIHHYSKNNDNTTPTPAMARR
jgi:hypothetical protein